MNYSLLNIGLWFQFLAGRHIRPWLRLNSLADLDTEMLQHNHIKGIAFDVDNTLTLHHGNKIHQDVAEKFKQCTDQFQCMIISNCGKTRHRELEDIFKIPIIPSGYKKPSRRSFRLVSRMLGLPADQIVVIGDRLMTDILGGNRSGFKTILTKPLSPNEPGAIRFMRSIERLRLKCLRN